MSTATDLGATPGSSPSAASADSTTDAHAQRTTLAVLISLSVCHGLNDAMQSLLAAVYPLLERNYSLSFTEIGIIHCAFMGTASVLQPAIGFATDRRPIFRIASLGMGATLAGLVVLATAGSYALLIVGAMLIGLGSSIFHPDSSRTARAASGASPTVRQARPVRVR